MEREAVGVRVDPPVGQRHAVEQARQSRVDAEAPGAPGPVAVRLAPGPVHRVEVVLQRASASPAARRQVAVGRRHHEVPAVDDLRAGQGDPGTDDPGGLAVQLGVRVREIVEVVPSGGRAPGFTRHCDAPGNRPFSCAEPPTGRLMEHSSGLIGQVGPQLGAPPSGPLPPRRVHDVQPVPSDSPVTI